MRLFLGGGTEGFTAELRKIEGCRARSPVSKTTGSPGVEGYAARKNGLISPQFLSMSSAWYHILHDVTPQHLTQSEARIYF